MTINSVVFSGETFKFPKDAQIINGRRSINIENPTTFALVLYESPVICELVVSLTSFPPCLTADLAAHPVINVRAGFGQIIINCTEPDGSTGGAIAQR